MKLDKAVERLDVHASDLSGSVFNDVNLSGASFDDVNMAGWKVTKVNLAGAIFEDSNLSGWVVTNVNLSGLRLTGANLAGASISGCRNMDQMTIDGIPVADLLAAHEVQRREQAAKDAK